MSLEIYVLIKLIAVDFGQQAKSGLIMWPAVKPNYL